MKFLQIIYLIRDFYQKYTKNSCNSIIKKQNNAKHLSKEEMQTANKHMKGFLTPLVIREWQIRTQRDTTSYHWNGYNQKVK